MEEKEIKMQAYELQELIAEAMQNYMTIIALITKNPSELQKYSEIISIIENAPNDFYNCYYYPRDLKKTTEAILDTIDTLDKKKAYIMTLGDFFSLPKIIQDISYYLNSLERIKQEISSWLTQNDIDKLQKHWIQDGLLLQCKLLNQVFNQANSQIEGLKLLAETQKNLEANNQKSKELMNNIESLTKQSEEIAKDTINKSRIAENTRTAIEKAIKVKLNEKYENRAEKLKKEEIRWTRNFYIGLIGLFFIGSYEVVIFAFPNQIAIIKNASFFPYQLLGLIPMHVAIIWFIVFSINRRNEVSKLACDYAHKEVFASSYLAYQHEINELKGKHTPEVQELITQLNLKLIDSMIDTLADNPAKNLDNKKKSSELPTKELINLVSEITRVKNLTPLPYLQTQAPQSEESK